MDGLMDGINSHKISRLKDKDVVEWMKLHKKLKIDACQACVKLRANA
jgi:hypothetical protein